MKALTLWQPWASLVALSEKSIETRIWSTKHRGPLAIHAAQKLPPKWLGASRNSEPFIQELADVLNCRIDRVDSEIRKLPYGKILCTVNLFRIEETRAVREILCKREVIFGNYEDGRYAWSMQVITRFEKPIPAKGNRMLWNWKQPGEIEAQKRLYV
jgi:hypothetical protein